jgi:hypothetical protein
MDYHNIVSQGRARYESLLAEAEAHNAAAKLGKNPNSLSVRIANALRALVATRPAAPKTRTASVK